MVNFCSNHLMQEYMNMFGFIFTIYANDLSISNVTRVSDTCLKFPEEGSG